MRYLTEGSDSCHTEAFHIIGVIALLASLVPLTGCTQQSAEEPTSMSAGVAVTDITPPIGYEQYRGTSTVVTTPLRAKAIVFEQNGARSAPR